ncbi:MAG TPA: TIGR03790 family protein [Candidatus Limnocylindrales bacterium]|nr:TIGR03790 family protein [Candidatus Limnocylindrales bacterium]
MRAVACTIWIAVLTFGLPHLAFSGGSGLNIAVVVNPNSANSLALGNYYCEMRHVPPQNVIRLENWAGGNIVWTRGQFQTALLNPLLAQVSARGLGPQIDFVLLSMDIPYEVVETDSINSTTSVLYYGFKPNTAPPQQTMSCSLPFFSSNSYAFSETVFTDSPPDTAPANAFLAMMLTASNLTEAKLTSDQGVASDSSFPTQPVYLARTSDTQRTARQVLFNDALFDARILGNVRLIITNQDSPNGLSGLLGYQTGIAQLNIQPNTFIPGAIADTLTSFGADLFQATGQASLLAFLAAGATASYGTVVEPCVNLEKFPSPRVYFYQGRGFSIAESYYQSLASPYQGLLVGDPLAAPFARHATGVWNLAPGALLTGTTNLGLQFLVSDTSRPIQQVDLFVDGTFVETLTNIVPNASNILSLALNGEVISYIVTTNATLQSIAAGLAASINQISNTTQVKVVPVGDRLALRSSDLSKTGEAIDLTIGPPAASGPPRTTFITASRSTFVDSPAFAAGSFDLNTSLAWPGDYLSIEIIKTNGLSARFSATNADYDIPLVTIARSLVDQVNSDVLLQGLDGVSAAVTPSDNPASAGALVIQARASGLGPSQIQVQLSASQPAFWLSPLTNGLEANLEDVQPRNHLYVSAGVTNLSVVVSLDTRKLSGGYHEFTAVAYEGTHIRTQTRITQSVIVSNTPLAASFQGPAGSTNWAAEATLIFSIVANTQTMSTIELFSSGGSLGVVTNQANATFSVSGSYLGAGLHPFYAMVTAASGAQYRTETKWIRLLTDESGFPVTITGKPPLLSWPALPGRRYDILSAARPEAQFQLRQSFVATNQLGEWLEGSGGIESNCFYRVRSSW